MLLRSIQYKFLLLPILAVSLGFGARPASAGSIPATDLDSLALGGHVASSSSDMMAFDYTTSSLNDIGNLYTDVYQNAGVYTYVVTFESAHDHISEFNTTFKVLGFNGTAGYSYGATDAAHADVAFDVQHDSDGTIDWQVTAGTVNWGESVPFFYQSDRAPMRGGAYNVINSVTGQARGLQPVPEPTSAVLFGIGLLVAGGCVSRRRSDAGA